MCQRKAWTKEEDQLLTKLMQESELAEPGQRLKWNEIAAKVSQLSQGRSRKGKQCRERWYNQLQPGINREAEWSPQEQALLFQLQAVHGNRWARIAKEIVGRSDNNIKNYFYSTLRKAIRRVNNYVTSHKHHPPYKNIKAFQINTLNKILTVAENKADKKIILGKQSATDLAKEIRDSLIRLQKPETDQESLDNEHMGALVAKIQDFNRICKRRKSKKKQYSSCENIEEDLSHSELQQNSQSISPSPSHLRSHFNSITTGRPADRLAQVNAVQQLSGSQVQPKEQAKIGPKQMEKEPLSFPKAVRQPIIPALDNSNCLANSSKIFSQGEPTVKGSQSLQQSMTTQGDQPLQPPVPELSFIPLIHSNYYSGSAFMPNPFFPRPFFGFHPEAHPSSYTGFAMGWEHDFAEKKGEGANPFLDGSQRSLQFEKGGKACRRE